MSQTPDPTVEVREIAEAMHADGRPYAYAVGYIRHYVDNERKSDAEFRDIVRTVLAALTAVDTPDLGDVASDRTPLPPSQPEGQWRPASNGAGKMRWFLIRETPGQQAEYHNGANGRLVRYGSHEAAQCEADRLNAAQLTSEPPSLPKGWNSSSRAALDIIRRQDDEGGVA